MPPELRAVRRNELPEVFALLRDAFPEANPRVFREQTLHDPSFRLRHGRVAIVGGRIAGYVRIFARTMLLDGAPTAAGGIGSVATHPEQRSAGLATDLLHDAITMMECEGMRVSFLFTGIPGFYERLGYRVVRQPEITADRRELAALPRTAARVRRIRATDTPALLRLHRASIAGATGAVVRTPAAWRAATRWLGESASVVALDGRGRALAYVRSRCGGHGHQVIDAASTPGAEDALRAALAAVARHRCACGGPIHAWLPAASPLAAVMRACASAEETDEVRFPMMVRSIGRGDATRAFDRAPLRFWNADRI
jgi:predicted N-acetyltransferase YhbS